MFRKASSFYLQLALIHRTGCGTRSDLCVGHKKPEARVPEPRLPIARCRFRWLSIERGHLVAIFGIFTAIGRTCIAGFRMLAETATQRLVGLTPTPCCPIPTLDGDDSAAVPEKRWIYRHR